MHRIRLAICTVAFAAAAVSAAGCGVGGSEPEKSAPSEVPSEIPSDLPSEVPSDLPTTPSGDSGTAKMKPGKLPDDFPLPPGSDKGSFTENGKTTRGTVTVSDGAEAYDFWAKKLPDKGYQVTDKRKVEMGISGSYIEFTGNGYSSGKIAIADTTATLSLTEK